MRGYIGLGSNLGDRRKNLFQSIELIKEKAKVLKYSPVFENPALMPQDADASWNLAFLNQVVQIQSDMTKRELLHFIQEIEKKIGRNSDHKKWAPRIIDIDILSIEGDSSQDIDLKIPHPLLHKRNFTLAPLKEINSTYCPLDDSKSSLSLYRALKQPLPCFMDIINITPDSFSETQDFAAKDFNISEYLKNKMDRNIESCVSYVDVGGYSTRPGAKEVSTDEEWNRISSFFDVLDSSAYNGIKISVDTFRSEVALQALKRGASIINDVSGLSDSSMLALLKKYECDYVLMHSLSIPASKSVTIKESSNPVIEVKQWLEQKLDYLEKNKIDLSRIIFDPGIGFGKTAQQSLRIIQNIDQFLEYPVRLMIGHSNKSFMNIFTSKPMSERMSESIGLSMQLAERGVDVIRAHEASNHARAWLSYQHGINQNTLLKG